jgi:hypothetical protein
MHSSQQNSTATAPVLHILERIHQIRDKAADTREQEDNACIDTIITSEIVS